jgi:DNA-binding FadR family transcriptional regulator
MGDLEGLEPGTFVGTEDRLAANYGVSAPTLRQAARLLEQLRVLEVRRGLGGGYYTREPDASTVTLATGAYLMSHGCTFAEIVEAAQMVGAEAAQLAAGCRDVGLRTHLKALMADFNAVDLGSPDKSLFFQHDAALADFVAKMSGNKFIHLIRQVVNSFGAVKSRYSLYKDKPGRAETWRKERQLLVKAVLSGDSGLARASSLSSSRLLMRWLEQDSHDMDRQVQMLTLTP